jgi:16S rRNA (guanine527-N7)-methyltransferase
MARTAVTDDPLAACSDQQSEQLEQFWVLVRELGSKHNLVGKDDIASRERFFDRHIRHSLSLSRRSFPDGSTVVDWGTGGGIPAIPLAIVFPDVSFVAIDAAEKKILAVRTMSRRIGLDNLTAWHGRAEEWAGKTDYSVSRATASLEVLWSWHTRARRQPRCTFGPGDWSEELICLKGGDLRDEIVALRESDGSVGVSLISLDPLSASFTGKVIVGVGASTG